jgi:hypothetical protein
MIEIVHVWFPDIKTMPGRILGLKQCYNMLRNSKGRLTHSMPFPLPCRAAKGLECVFFTFDLHSAVVSDSHLPRHAHAMPRPCCSSQCHGTAWPPRDGLWATCSRSASSGYHTEFHEDFYQKHTTPPHNDPYLGL